MNELEARFAALAINSPARIADVLQAVAQQHSHPNDIDAAAQARLQAIERLIGSTPVRGVASVTYGEYQALETSGQLDEQTLYFVDEFPID